MTNGVKAIAVRLSAAEKTYTAGSVEVTALRGISLEIPLRSFSMVVGPSGSGKTTLLNLIGCIDEPSSGAVGRVTPAGMRLICV